MAGEARSVIDEAIDRDRETAIIGAEAIDALATAAATGVVPTTIALNGQELSIQDAIARLQNIQASQDEDRFDITKPRHVLPVPIEIGGKVRHLRLPFWALKKFQQVTGLSPWDHSKVWGYPADLEVTVTMLWAGLLDENPDLTLEEVWRFEGADFANIHYIRYCLDECWGRNSPPPDPNAKPSSGPLGTQTSSSTGPLVGTT